MRIALIVLSKISNIEILNETKEVIDASIRFIIGCSYFIELKKKSADETLCIPQRKMGIIHIIDQLIFIEGGQSSLFIYEVNTIYTANLF